MGGKTNFFGYCPIVCINESLLGTFFSLSLALLCAVRSSVRHAMVLSCQNQRDSNFPRHEHLRPPPPPVAGALMPPRNISPPPATHPLSSKSYCPSTSFHFSPKTATPKLF